MHKPAFVVLVLAGGLAHAERIVTLGTPTIGGKLDAKIVTVALQKLEPRIFACYKQADAKDAAATAAFTIQVDGSVANVAALGVTPTVSACLVAALSKLQFAKQSGPSEIQVPITMADTIGHGSGYGVGSDGNHWRKVPPPPIRLGDPIVKGGLDKAIVRRYVKRHIQKIIYCYEKQLLVDDKLAGTVATKFTIDAEGFVTGATASGVDRTVAECIQTVISRIEFPKPKSGEAAVKYPFVFAQAKPKKPAKK